MKKQIVHFSVHYGITFFTACGADIQCGFLGKYRITNHRDKVTCGNCKATKRFRKIK